MNVANRYILAVAVEPLKAEFGVSDSAIGLLTGLAFTVFYVTLGIPIARLADRANRRNIIAIAALIWSAMTMLTGFARSFVHLIVLRVLVGVGESGLTPPAVSMLANLFPVSRRGTAMSIYAVGSGIGFILAFNVGGWAVEAFGWRRTMILIGLPGLILGIVFWLFVSEPQRQLASSHSDQKADAHSLKYTLQFMWSQRSLRHLIVGSSLLGIGAAGLPLWTPAFLARSHGIATSESGFWLGIIYGVGGIIGMYLDGVLMDKLCRRDIRWHAWSVGWASVVGVIPATVMFLVPSAAMMLSLNAIYGVLGIVFYGPALAMTANLVQDRMRASATAILLLCVNFFGMGLGPELIGILSDVFSVFLGLGQDSLRYALTIGALFTAMGSISFFVAARTLRQDYQHSENAQ